MSLKRLQVGLFFGSASLLMAAHVIRPTGYNSVRPGAIKGVATDRAQEQEIPVLRPSVVKTFPHDLHAFTQGLEYYRGYLYESTGIAGQSTLREVALESGRIVRQFKLDPQYFGEGLTIFRGKIYQLTWLSKTGFVYDLHTWRRTGEFHYEGEGWGLTHDEKSLIMSDGTNKIRFIDSRSFVVTRTIDVYAKREAVVNLNELEYVNKELLANIWHSPRIARIDPNSGQVLGWIDLKEIAAKEQRSEEDVLNGIAYDQSTNRLFITGKHWSRIFEIKLEQR